MTGTKKTNWNAILSKPHMSKAAINFALGVMSGEGFKEIGSFTGCGGSIRNLVRNNGAVKAREITRRALKRRRLLNERNLTNPLVYAQL